MNSQLATQQEGRKFLSLRFFFKSKSWKSSGDNTSSESKSLNCKLHESLLRTANIALLVAQVPIPHMKGNDPSTEVHDPWPTVEELEFHSLEEPCPKIDDAPLPIPEFNDFPPEVCHNLSPKIERKLSELNLEKQDGERECFAEIFIFPPPEVLTIPFEDEDIGKASESQKNVSPSFTRSNFLLKYGEKLTEAGKSLNDEEMNLLYQDIFKPLDFYLLLHERSKRASLLK